MKVYKMGEGADIPQLEEQTVVTKSNGTQSSRQNGVFCWRARTKNERYLMLMLTTVLFVAVLLAFSLATIFVKRPFSSETSEGLPQAALLQSKNEVPSVNSASTSKSQTNGVCLTKGCVKAAAAVLKRIDESADPCDDFFDFACGSFVKKTIIPDEKSSVTMFSEVQDDLREKMRLLLEEEITPTDSPSTLKAKNLYKSCMDIETIKTTGLEPLRTLLKEMGGWPVLEPENSWNESAFSWIENNYINRRVGFSVDYLFDFSVTTDIRNSSWRMIWLDQPSLGMSREYLMRGLNDTDVQAYLQFSIDVAVLLGADPIRAAKEMREVLDFQISIANISLPREERRNMTRLYNVMSLADVGHLTRGIPWVEYLNRLLVKPIQVDENERTGVSDPNFFRNLTDILERTPNRVIANYMLWRVASASASYLSEDIRNIQLEYSKKLTGKSTRPPRWKECMGLVSGKLSYAISNLYVKNFFNEDAKAQAEELVMYTRQYFNQILQSIDWMDNATRAEAMEKAAAIKSHIGFPEELLMDEKLTEYYKNVTIDDKSLLDNMRRLGIFGTNYSFSRLREMVDKNDWKRHASVAVVNAYYSSIENSIKFPAGILQGVFFEPDRPKYMNFGGIGFVIGHEITHGFDDQGKQFNAVGNLKNWWQPETEKKFLEKAKCIIHQYGNFTAPENGMNLNGVNTQGENIADNGGVKEAYNAYQLWVAKHGAEDTLPSLNYTSNQLFWISAGQVWCSKYRPESLKIRILTGVHSPGRFRVVGSFSNSAEFSKDWNCPLGSNMNPEKKCSIW